MNELRKRHKTESKTSSTLAVQLFLLINGYGFVSRKELLN
jgi:hypothetical protein